MRLKNYTLEIESSQKAISQSIFVLTALPLAYLIMTCECPITTE